MIVFLDFDGVTSGLGEDRFFSEENIDALNAAFEGLPLRVVVTSSWREFHSLDQMQGYLEHLNAFVIDSTPLFPEDTPYQRHEECLAWLKQNFCEDEDWIAIDDAPQLFPEGCQNLYLTDSDMGFTDFDVEPFKDTCEMIRSLNNPSRNLI